MKQIVTIFSILLLFGCGTKPQSRATEPPTAGASADGQLAAADMALTAEPLPVIDSALMQKITTGNAITIRYTKPVRGYTVRGWAVPEGCVGGMNVVLHFKGNGHDFMVRGGLTHSIDPDQKQEIRTYEESYEQGVLSAPYDLFFFADIDFDGVEELITHLEPFRASQRCFPAYTEIYTFRDGQPQRATALFNAKNKLFSAIEPCYFMVNPERKEIYQYCDGGALCGSWKVYKYERDTYRYDHYVHWEEVYPTDSFASTDSIAVEIRTPKGVVKHSFTTIRKTFDQACWTY